jgi:type I restriction enzyme M protein
LLSLVSSVVELRAMKRHGTPQSLNAAVKGICDIMRRSNCAGALQYVPELT